MIYLVIDNLVFVKITLQHTSLMLELFDKIYSAKERGKRPGILFLDIKKAFDSVDHDILLKKLKHYGIKDTVYNWLKSYLSKRFQSTKIEKWISITLLILWGVPQGSILQYIHQ